MVTGEVTIAGRVTVNGDVKLILADGANLTVNGGINVEEGQQFTVYAQSTGDAMGALTAQNCGRDMAGIGSASGTAGTITINGGTISALGGQGAAGIGSAYNGAGSSNINGGTITINGGSVTATGGFYSDFVSMGGAGIGGGAGGDGGTININGGTVEAGGNNGGYNKPNSQAIGTGGGGTGGSITITGGTYAAGIGGGIGGSGNVTIIDGSVTVNGVEAGGAGIGDGCQTDLSTRGGNVTIRGGIVTATGGGQVEGSPTNLNGGAGIGGLSGCTITISGGTITAVGSTDGGAGIGGNYGQTGGRINITGGIVMATGGSNAAGIGGGAGASGNVSISRGTVTATGGSNAAGIGGGYGGSGDVTIIDGTITANGGSDAAGIGSGLNGEEGTFTTNMFSTAVIFASSISDNDDTSGWGGIIFQGDEGQAYGNPTPIINALTIPEGKTLTVERGHSLDNWIGADLTNLGTIRVNQGGTYWGDQPQGNPVQYQMGWDTDGDGTVDDTTYVAYGETPDHADGSKDPDQQYSYTFTGWSPELAEADAPATYTAQFQPVLRSYTVSLPTGEGYTASCTGSNVVDYGGDFTFTVELEPGYAKTDAFVVAANGTPLTANADGSYTCRVEGDTQITVEGVADLTAPANLTVSYGTDSFKELMNTLTFGLMFKDTVTVTLSATDEGSGVQSFTYRLGDGQLQTVAAENGQYTFDISPEFKGNLSGVTARDAAGNTTTETAYEYFAVERQAPDVPQVSALGAGQWTSGPVTFTLSGAQATSGIQKYQYSTDGGEHWQDVPATQVEAATVQNPANVLQAELAVTENAATSQGVTYVFRAVSNAGHASQATRSYAALIDGNAPAIEVTGNTEAYLTGDTVHIQASAGASGVAKVEVALNGGDFQDITDAYSQGYAVTENGTYTFRVTSGAGLTGQTSLTYSKLDSAQPVVLIDSGSYTDGSWATDDVTLSVSNATANLGNTTFRYRVDEGEWQDWTGPITVTQDTVTLNGQPVEPTVTLTGNTDAVYTLVATDQAGNQTSLTVTMRPIASLEEGLEGMDPDHVTSDDRETVQDYIDDLEEQLGNDSLTDEERQQLEDMKSQAEDLLDQIDQAAQAGSTENTDKVAQITPDNVKPGDKENLEAAREDLENALEHFGDHYTDQEQQQLEETLERIDSALEAIQQVERVEQAIGALPDTVSPDDTQAEAAINAVKEAYDALTEHQQSLISQELRHKLESLLGDLGDYRIIQGNDGQWTQGSGSNLTIVANGAFSKFTGLLVDGQSLDAANYTAVSGSTVITLKAGYLATLSVGRHTLTVCYTDGQVNAGFEILAQTGTQTTTGTAPTTGDGSAPLLWVTLLVLAGALLTGLGLWGKKKKRQG